MYSFRLLSLILLLALIVAPYCSAVGDDLSKVVEDIRKGTPDNYEQRLSEVAKSGGSPQVNSQLAVLIANRITANENEKVQNLKEAIRILSGELGVNGQIDVLVPFPGSGSTSEHGATFLASLYQGLIVNQDHTINFTYAERSHRNYQDASKFSPKDQSLAFDLGVMEALSSRNFKRAVEILFTFDKETEQVSLNVSRTTSIGVYLIANNLISGGEDGLTFGSIKISVAELLMLGMSLDGTNQSLMTRFQDRLVGHLQGSSLGKRILDRREIVVSCKDISPRNQTQVADALRSLSQETLMEAQEAVSHNCPLDLPNFQVNIIAGTVLNTFDLPQRYITQASPAFPFVKEYQKAERFSFKAEERNLIRHLSAKACLLWFRSYDDSNKTRIADAQLAISMTCQLRSACSSFLPLFGESKDFEGFFQSELSTSQEELKELLNLIYLIDSSSIFQPTPPNSVETVELYRLIEKNPRLQSLPWLVMNISVALTQLQHIRESDRCNTWLAQIPSALDLVEPMDAAFKDDRKFRLEFDPNYDGSTKLAQDWDAVLNGVVNPSPAQIRSALVSLRLMNSGVFKEKLRTVISSGSQINPNRLVLILDALQATGVPGFDDVINKGLENFDSVNPSAENRSALAACGAAGGLKSFSEIHSLFVNLVVNEKTRIAPVLRHSLARDLIETVGLRHPRIAIGMAKEFYSRNPSFIQQSPPFAEQTRKKRLLAIANTHSPDVSMVNFVEQTYRPSVGGLTGLELCEAMIAKIPKSIVESISYGLVLDSIKHLKQGLNETPEKLDLTLLRSSRDVEDLVNTFLDEPGSARLTVFCKDYKAFLAAPNDYFNPDPISQFAFWYRVGLQRLRQLDAVSASLCFEITTHFSNKLPLDNRQIMVSVANLPFPIPLEDTIALAKLMDPSSDPNDQGVLIDKILSSDAASKTSLCKGLHALRFFASNKPPKDGDWSTISVWLRMFNELYRSGLAPNLFDAGTYDLVLSTEADVELRIQNLADRRCGVRICFTNDDGSKRWLFAEDALAEFCSKFGGGKSTLTTQRLQAAFGIMKSTFCGLHCVSSNSQEPEYSRLREFEFLSSLDKADNSVLARNTNGVSLFLNGHHKKAIDEFRACTDLDNVNSIVFVRLAEGTKSLVRERALLDNEEALEQFSLLTSMKNPPFVSELPNVSDSTALTAQVNLAISHYVLGDYDNALEIIRPVYELKLRGIELQEGFLEPSCLSQYFRMEYEELLRAADSLFKTQSAINTGDSESGRQFISLLPQKLLKTSVVRYKQLQVMLDILSTTQADRRSESLSALDQELARLIKEFPSDLSLKVLKLEIESLQQRTRNATELTNVYLDVENELIALEKLIASKSPPTKEAITFLNFMPSLLVNYSGLFTGSEGKLQSIRDRYGEIIKQSCKGELPETMTLAVFEPLTRKMVPGIDKVVAVAFPQNGKEIQALSSVGASGVSKLDWMLSVLVASASKDDGSEVRTLLMERLTTDKISVLDSEFPSFIDALFAVAPTQACEVALSKLSTLKPKELASQLDSVAVKASRRQGAFLVPRVQSFTTGSWFCDAQAFSFYPAREAHSSFGEVIVKMTEIVGASEQQFALMLDAYSKLFSTSNLSAVAAASKSKEIDQSDRAGIGRLYSSLAMQLVQKGIPASLAILQRYLDGDCQNTCLDASRSIAYEANYSALMRTPWLADVPDTKSSTIGPVAWKTLKSQTPSILRVNSPVPTSHFMSIVLDLINKDASNGITGPDFQFKSQASLAMQVYNQLIDYMQLPPTPVPDVNSFESALDATKKRYFSHLKASETAKGKTDAELQEFASFVVEDAAKQFTMKLWAVIALKSNDKTFEIINLSLRDISRQFDDLMNGVSSKTVVFDEVKAPKLYRENLAMIQSLQMSSFTEFDDSKSLTNRAVFVAKDSKESPPFFVESYEGKSFTGKLPLSYVELLRSHPAFLDALGLSLTRREMLIHNPLGPERLSIDMSIRSPHISWPVLMQTDGREHLNSFLAMATKDKFPLNAEQFIASIAPSLFRANDNIGPRQEQYEATLNQIASAYVLQSYSARVFERSHEIPDKLREKLFGFLPIREFDNAVKVQLMNYSAAKSAESHGILSANKQLNVFALADDPPEYVLLASTEISNDRKLWCCNYKIHTSKGNVIDFPVSGKVDELADVLRYLIDQNIALVRHLPIDLSGLTVSPEVQVGLAIASHDRVSFGSKSLIKTMEVEGLDAEEMRHAISFDISLLKDDDARRMKAERYREIYSETLPAAIPIDNRVSNKRLEALTKSVSDWSKKFKEEGVTQGDGSILEAKRNSHDIHTFGIPGIIAVSFQGGKLVNAYVIVRVSGVDTGTPSVQFNIPQRNDWLLIQEREKENSQIPKWWKKFDPKLDYERVR